MVNVLRSGRLPAVLLTLALHGALLALLLYSFQRLTRPQKPERETLLRLPRLIEPKPAERTIDARGNPRSLPGPPLFVPPAPEIPLPEAAARPDVPALGRALFSCAPEIYASLSPEQRARCARPGEGMAMLDAPNLMGTRSQVKGEAHWQAEWAREQSPLWIPCTMAINGAPAIDWLCVAAMAAKGTLADPHSWPTYQVREIPPEDFRKIEQAYDAWHKAHRENHLAAAH